MMMNFPYSEPDPLSEYMDNHLFEKAFPWLFPGGKGGYLSLPGKKSDISIWTEKIEMYQVHVSSCVLFLSRRRN